MSGSSTRFSGAPVRRLVDARSVRSFALQAALVGAVLLVLAAAGINARDNMHARGIPTGLGFWSQPAGFNIDQTLIHFDAASTFGAAFFVGLLNTLLVAGLGVVFATIIGFVIGVARLSSNFLVAKLAEAYVESIRNVPLLLQLLFWYNAVLKQLPPPRRALRLFGAVLNNRGLDLPQPVAKPGAVWVAAVFVLGLLLSVAWAWRSRRIQTKTGRRPPILPVVTVLVLAAPSVAFFAVGRPLGFDPPVLRGFNYVGGIHVLPEFAALLLGLSLYTASFIAEVVRAGLLAVDRGQIEASRALGLPDGLALRLIVIPQALRVIVPPLTNQYLNLTKNSSLAVFIGYPDLVQVFAGTVLNQTGAAVQVIAITMAVYLTISLATSFAMGLFNRRVAFKEA